VHTDLVAQIRLRFGRIAFVLALWPGLLSASWYDDYEEGVKAARAGNWTAVIDRMTKAIGGNATENNRARTYGINFVNYHPYYYRGVANLNLGRNEEALADFERSSGPGTLDFGPIDVLIRRTGLKVTVPPPTTAAVPSPVPPVTQSRPPVPLSGAPPTPSTRPPVALTTTRPPDAAPASSSLTFAKDALVNANIAFNAPDHMINGEAQVIELLLDTQRAAQALAAQIKEPGKVETARIGVTATVEAHLAGSAFRILAVTPEEQAITTNATTQWKWEVTPQALGRHRLFLTVNAIISAGADERKHSIRTFDHVIEVRVSPTIPIETPASKPNVGASVVRWILPLLAVILLALVVAFRIRASKLAEKTAVMSPAQLRSGSFAAGDLVASRYRIVRFIGKGGMGMVYAAEDAEFGGELVALKTVIATGEGEERALARFKREIQLARRVAHPNVSRIFDVGHHVTDEGRTVFVTMQYIEGKTLARIIREKQRFTEREALPIIRDVAAGLDATHAEGMIHRDVKSGNVMITNDGRAVLMDFGLASVVGTDSMQPSLTLTDAVIGSPMYMAPEQLEHGLLSPATDIYAFGIVIYEMVTGQLPYQASTPMGVIAKRLKEAPTPPTDFRPDLDPAWTATILACLHRDPARRFQTAQAVVDSLPLRPAETTQIL
jgi:predicted Ser/Thr protein kinase